MTDAEFRALVREHVRSVWALELILLLRREPLRLWRSEELLRELRASRSLIRDNLARLRAGGLVIAEGADSFRFGPAGPILQAFCDTLAEAYETRPVALINLIASQGKLQALSDAFKIKGQDP